MAISSTPASTYQLRDYGLRDAWDGDSIGRRSVANTVVEEPDDWRRLPRLDPYDGFTGRLLDAADFIRRELPPSVPVLMTVFNPFFQAAALGGIERLRQHLEICPDAVGEGLARIAANTCRLIARLRSAGCDGIFLAVQHAQNSVSTQERYARHGLPGDLDCLAAARSMPLNMLHLHGTGVHAGLFDALGDVTLHFEAAADNPDPAGLLSRGIAVSSGPCPALLASQPAPLVRAACDDMLARWKGKGFILTSGCTVPYGASPAGMDAMRAAARSPRPDRDATPEAIHG